MPDTVFDDFHEDENPGTLESAIVKLKGTIDTNRSKTSGEIKVIKSELEKLEFDIKSASEATNGYLRSTNVLLANIANRLNELWWVLVLFAIIAVIIGLLSTISLYSDIVENRNRLERIEKEIIHTHNYAHGE